MADLTETERMLVGMLAAICCSGGKNLQGPSVFGPGLARAAGILKKATTKADIKRGLDVLTDSMDDTTPPEYCNPEGPEQA